MRFHFIFSLCLLPRQAIPLENIYPLVKALETFRRLDNNGGGKLHRHGSAMSLTSNSHSASSAKAKGLGLDEKLAECETFKV